MFKWELEEAERELLRMEAEEPESFNGPEDENMAVPVGLRIVHGPKEFNRVGIEEGAREVEILANLTETQRKAYLSLCKKDARTPG